MFHGEFKDPYRKVRPKKDVELREINSDEYQELLEFSPTFNRQQMLKRLATNHRCYIANVDDGIVFHTWIGVGKFYLPELGKDINLGKDTLYFYNTFTDPRYHNRGIFPAFITRAREVGLEMGYNYFITLVNTQSHLPIRAYSNLFGAYKVSYLRYRRIMGIKRYNKREVTIEEADYLSRGKKGIK